MRRQLVFLLTLLLTAITAASAAEDGTVFATNCVACHGADGSANTPQGRKVKAHDLRLSKMTDAEIEHQIREGAKTKAGAVAMPAFGHDLTDAQIQEAIRTVKSFRAPVTR